MGHLHRDAALQDELQLDHVHLGAGAQLGELGRARSHLVDGHVHRLQLHLPLGHHLHPLLHVGEGVGGWGTGGTEGRREGRGTYRKVERKKTERRSMTE